MNNCFNDLTHDELKAFKERYQEIDLNLVVNFVATIKRCHWVLNLLETFLSQHGLSHGRFGVMIEMMRRLPEASVSQVELAERYGAKAATISGLVDNLVRDGMVERVPNQNDRRKVDLNLTDDGLAFMEDYLPKHYAMLIDAFSELSEEERETLVKLLSKVYQGISRHLEQEYSAELDGRTLIK